MEVARYIQLNPITIKNVFIFVFVRRFFGSFFSVSVQEITSEMRQPNVDSDLSPDPDWTMVAFGNGSEKASDVVEVAQDAQNELAEVPHYDFTVPIEDLAVIKK